MRYFMMMGLVLGAVLSFTLGPAARPANAAAFTLAQPKSEAAPVATKAGYRIRVRYYRRRYYRRRYYRIRIYRRRYYRRRYYRYRYYRRYRRIYF